MGRPTRIPPPADGGDELPTEDDSFEALLREAARVTDVPIAAADDPLPAGASLCDGRFRIERTLGAGGMGVVYEAHDRQRGCPVALKTLRAASPRWLRRLRREFLTLGDLAHPNLVELGELLVDAGRWFFTMELVRGEPFLAHVRPGGSLDPERLRRALAQLVEALAVLHVAGKVHCDIKPSNVLVAGGRVVLLDFGLVTDADAMPDEIGGTPAYMAPEQAAGAIAPAADWYAVGTMLHEALTGSLPFGEGGRALLEAKRRGLEAGALAGVAPAELAALCRELLAPEPDDRPDGAAIALVVGAPVHAPREAAPFVGRARELEALRAAAADARDGCVVVHVSGESGAGKSALVTRFADRLRAERGTLVLRGRCYERVSVPFKAVDGVVAALAAHLRTDAEARALAARDPDVALLPEVFPALGDIDGFGGAGDARIVDPQERRARVFGAFGRMLATLAAARPLALVVDDLQWADHDGLRLLEHVVRDASGAPLLVVLASRAAALGERAPVLAERARPCELGPLEPADASALIRRLSGTAGAVAGDAIAREAGGNPLYIAELVRYWRSAASTDPGAPAPRLEEAIGRRAAALPRDQARLIALVAVAGGPIPQVLAQRACALEGAAFWSAVSGLRAAQLIRTRGPRGADAVEPYHDRVRHAIAAALSESERAADHRRMVEALERDPLADERPELLLYHLEGAGERERAAVCAERAADRAAAALAFDRAAELYEHALRLGAGDGDEVRARLGDALANAGRGARAAEEYLMAAAGLGGDRALELRRRAAEALLRSGHTDRGAAIIAGVLREVGLPVVGSSRWTIARLLVQRARLRLVRRGRAPRRAPLGDRERRRLDSCWAAVVGMSMASPLSSNVYQALYVRLAFEAGDPRRIALGMALESIGAAAAGPPAARAHVLWEDARRWAQRVGDAQTRAYLEVARGTIAFLCGDWAEALPHTDEAERLFREQCVGAFWEIGTAQRISLTCLWHMGRIRELRRRVGDALDEAESRGDLYASTQLRTVLQPNVRLMEDRVDDARAELARAARELPRRGVHLQHWQHMQASALTSLYAGEPAEAADAFAARVPAMRRAFLFRVQAVRVFTYFVRGGACVGAAAAGTDARDAYLRRAEADRARLVREGVNLAAPDLLGAQIAVVRGDLDAAAELYRSAATGFRATDMNLLAAAARWRLGTLLGGDEGAALAEGAVAQLDAEGVARPERALALFAPVDPRRR